MIVFVHGVPETAALWDKVRALIDDESTALSLPGFGNPRPEGFGATKDDYADWLAAELAKIDGPVDLVGHDWGAGFTFRVATTRPELLRSWVIDVGNVFHPDYEWHDFAKIWQTPGAGEEFFKSQNAASPEDRATIFESMGVPHDDAVAMAAAGDDTMASCILDLYRSAVPNSYKDWGDAVGQTGVAGLVIHPSDDPFGDAAKSAEVASMLGARTATLEGAGHWWAVQAPEAAVAILKDFWTTLS